MASPWRGHYAMNILKIYVAQNITNKSIDKNSSDRFRTFFGAFV